MSAKYVVRSIVWTLVSAIILASSLAPAGKAHAQSMQLIPGISNEGSNLSTSNWGYYEFRDVTKIFNYSNGTACISSSATSCTSLQIDDGIKIWINGAMLIDAESRTQAVGPFHIPTHTLKSMGNSVRVVLYDKLGPYRGGSPVYLVLNPTATSSTQWPCPIPNARDFVKKDDTEFEVFTGWHGNLRRFAVANYSVTGRICDGLTVKATPVNVGKEDEGLQWDVDGQIGNQSVNFGITYDGKVEAGVNVPLIGEGLTGVFNLGNQFNYVFQTGLEYKSSTDQIGKFGVDIDIVTQALSRYRYGEFGRFNYSPSYDAEEIRIMDGVYGLYSYALYILLIGTVLLLSDLPPARDAFGVPAQQPSIASVTDSQLHFATYRTSNFYQTSVPADVVTAVNTRLGVVSKNITLVNLTARDRISAFTRFEYVADGFTPNGPVFVHFGLPNGQKDIVRQIVKADPNGRIRSTIEMPDIVNTPLGRYSLIAVDYEKMENSVYRFLADMNYRGMNTHVAAKLIDVVKDVTPPVTVANATGPLDTNNIFRNTVTVNLTATDDLSGVARTEYSLDGGITWKTATSFTLNGNGITQFVYRSIDKYGNVEAFKNSGRIIINKYVVFANDPTASLVFDSNAGLMLNGSGHTNGSVKAIGNISTKFNGTLTAVNTASTMSGNLNSTINVQGGSAVPMLTYNMTMLEKSANVVHTGDLVISSASAPLSGVYFVKGNITIQAARVTGHVTLVATGNIIDTSASSSFTNSDPRNGIIYYAGGNIEIRSAKNTYLGLFYAPNGTVLLNRPASGVFNGSFVGKSVQFVRAGSVTVKYDAAFANGTYQLPIASVAAASVDLTPPEGELVTPSGNQIYLPNIQHE